MGNPPTTGLTAETRELLTLIREALDLPFGATADDNRKRRELRGDNAVRIASTLDYILDEGPANFTIAVQCLRKGLAANPVDYVTRDGEAGR